MQVGRTKLNTQLEGLETCGIVVGVGEHTVCVEANPQSECGVVRLGHYYQTNASTKLGMGCQSASFHRTQTQILASTPLPPSWHLSLDHSSASDRMHQLWHKWRMAEFWNISLGSAIGSWQHQVGYLLPVSEPVLQATALTRPSPLSTSEASDKSSPKRHLLGHPLGKSHGAAHHHVMTKESWCRCSGLG